MMKIVGVCEVFFGYQVKKKIRSQREKYTVSISVCTGYINMIMMIFDLHRIRAEFGLLMVVVAVEDYYK